ncbi:hypothetical protein QWY28_14840 [Nocardioides sp. SOB77]|uniref:Lipoprotein n=1 Tax=Nocardioides oceani TaxID=3058369 RepID=A0ABT8FHU2_9ACTN|nr:hypothetical protein [Nocardioides oceani]MDN4174238.1 hypothetical protein [Nocardioides oceani]
MRRTGRTERTRRAVVGLAVAVVVLAGCGGGGDEPRPAADGSAPASEQPEPPEQSEQSEQSEPPAEEEPLPCVPGVEPFTGPAADRFGAESVMAAYCTLAELSLEHAFTDLIVPAQGRSARAYAGPRPVLTPAARARWDADVAAYLRAGDGAAHDRIDALVLTDVVDVPKGFRLADDPPPAIGDEVGARAVASVVGERLRLAVPVRTGIVLERRGDDSGRHLLLPVTKRLSVDLERTGSGRWLVADWSARWSRGRVQLVFG